MITTSQIKPDSPVVCSNNGQFGIVDHLEGPDTIKLKKDKSGQHHYIPVSWVSKVDDKVHVNRPGEQAMREWSTVAPQGQSGSQQRDTRSQQSDTKSQQGSSQQGSSQQGSSQQGKPGSQQGSNKSQQGDARSQQGGSQQGSQQGGSQQGKPTSQQDKSSQQGKPGSHQPSSSK